MTRSNKEGQDNIKVVYLQSRFSNNRKFEYYGISKNTKASLKLGQSNR